MCSRSCELGGQPSAGVIQVHVPASIQTREIGAAKLVEHARVGVVRTFGAKAGLGCLDRPQLGVDNVHRRG